MISLIAYWKNKKIYLPILFQVVASLLFCKKILSAQFADNNVFTDMHLITAGVEDADRLAYCTRNAICATLDTDMFYYKRFLHGYTIL